MIYGRLSQELIKNVVEVADGHGNTLLSEAAAGGSLATVQMLLHKGADPNALGEFKRTPLVSGRSREPRW